MPGTIEPEPSPVDPFASIATASPRETTRSVSPHYVTPPGPAPVRAQPAAIAPRPRVMTMISGPLHPRGTPARLMPWRSVTNPDGSKVRTSAGDCPASPDEAIGRRTVTRYLRSRWFCSPVWLCWRGAVLRRRPNRSRTTTDYSPDLRRYESRRYARARTTDARTGPAPSWAVGDRAEADAGHDVPPPARRRGVASPRAPSSIGRLPSRSIVEVERDRLTRTAATLRRPGELPGCWGRPQSPKQIPALSPSPSCRHRAARASCAARRIRAGRSGRSAAGARP